VIAAAEPHVTPEVALGALGATSVIARGGLGTVEALDPGLYAEEGPLVLKRYHQRELVDAVALRALVQWRRELSAAERGRLDRIAAWPLAVATEGAEVAGFVMRHVPDDFSESIRLPSGRARRILREAQYLVADGVRLRRLGLDEASLAMRMEIVWSLSEIVAFLHRHRVVLGDLSTRNVLWAPPHGRVMLVDCDSVTLGGIGAPLPPTSTVDWDDPAQPDVAAASSDVYKHALLVLRILCRQFQTRDAGTADDVLDPAGRGLLRMSLDADPGARPRADAWERWAAGRRAASKT
jgi:hypothetical protein